MAKDRYLQAVRGAAICAVVLIHCLPQCDASVVARPFLNWGVAAFIFLSGYLTIEEKIMRRCISFLDNDDCVRLNFAKSLYCAVKGADADIAVCSFDRINLETGKL